MIKFLALNLLCISLISCNYIKGQKIKGNGEISTETRQHADFKGVSTSGVFNVHITTGDEFQVKVESDENLLPYVETDVENKILKISTSNKYNIQSTKGVNVFITAPIYNKLSTAGSGNLTGENEIIADEDMDVSVAGSGNIKLSIKAPSVKASIAGSGDILLEGEASEIKASIAGSGNIKAVALKTREAIIKIAGSGNAEVAAEEKLEAKIAGSGDILYAGNPKTETKIAGSGSIKKID